MSRASPNPNDLLASEQMLTSADLESLFRIGSRTVRRWVSTGHLPAPIVVGGRNRRWRQRDIQAMIDRQNAKPV